MSVDCIPHPSLANGLQTRSIIAAFLLLHNDAWKALRQCKWDSAAPEYKTLPHLIEGLAHDL